MPRKHVNPNRMELSRLQKQQATAVRGHRLLKDKQDELIRRFLELVRYNGELREQVERNIEASLDNFALARAAMDEPMTETALLAPGEQVRISATFDKIMNVEVPQFTHRYRGDGEENLYPYGFAFTSGDLDTAVKNISDILPQMLELAQVEHTCQLLAAEIESTRRRVNALEHILIPETQEQIRYISMKLEENERSNQVRLMKVKDMILEDQFRKNRLEK